MSTRTSLDRALQEAVGRALGGTEFEYDSETFTVDTVDWSSGAIEVEAVGESTTITGPRWIAFVVRIESVEDLS